MKTIKVRSLRTGDTIDGDNGAVEVLSVERDPVIEIGAGAAMQVRFKERGRIYTDTVAADSRVTLLARA